MAMAEAAWLTDVARPALDRLRRQVAWPSDIATYCRGAMVIRRTTNHLSPLSVVDERVGSRIPVLGSALGMAYLAYTPTVTREAILTDLESSDPIDRDAAWDRVGVDRMLAAVVVDRGFALRVGGIVPRTFSIGLPIMGGGVAVAAMNIICFSTALSVDQAITDLLAPMRDAVAEIETGLAAADVRTEFSPAIMSPLPGQR